MGAAIARRPGPRPVVARAPAVVESYLGRGRRSTDAEGRATSDVFHGRRARALDGRVPRDRGGGDRRHRGGRTEPARPSLIRTHRRHAPGPPRAGRIEFSRHRTSGGLGKVNVVLQSRHRPRWPKARQVFPTLFGRGEPRTWGAMPAGAPQGRPRERNLEAGGWAFVSGAGRGGAPGQGSRPRCPGGRCSRMLAIGPLSHGRGPELVHVRRAVRSGLAPPRSCQILLRTNPATLNRERGLTVRCLVGAETFAVSLKLAAKALWCWRMARVTLSPARRGGRPWLRRRSCCGRALSRDCEPILGRCGELAGCRASASIASAWPPPRGQAGLFRKNAGAAKARSGPSAWRLGPGDPLRPCSGRAPLP